jgi:hypothetical protein
VGLRDPPPVPGLGPPARHADQLHGLHRAHRGAALRDGRRGLRARRNAPGDRAHVPARARRDRSRSGGLLDQLRVHAPGCRRQTGSQPLRRARRGRGAVHGGGPGGQGGGAQHAGPPVQLSRLLRAAAAHRAAVPVPAVRGAGRRASPPAPAARAGAGARREGLAAGHTAAAHHGLHAGRAVQSQHRQGLRGADAAQPRGAPGCLPRPRLARPGRRGPGAGDGDEAALGDLPGLRASPS